MSNPSETEIAWLAGLLEGEGSFQLVIDKRSKGRRNRITVALRMSDEDVVERAKALMLKIHPFNVTTLKRSVKKDSDPRRNVEKWSPCYEFKVGGAAAAAIMTAIRPYMGNRRGAKIDKIMATPNLSHHPGGRYKTSRQITGIVQPSRRGEH